MEQSKLNSITKCHNPQSKYITEHTCSKMPVNHLECKANTIGITCYLYSTMSCNLQMQNLSIYNASLLYANTWATKSIHVAKLQHLRVGEKLPCKPVSCARRRPVPVTCRIQLDLVEDHLQSGYGSHTHTRQMLH